MEPKHGMHKRPERRRIMILTDFGPTKLWVVVFFFLSMTQRGLGQQSRFSGWFLSLNTISLDRQKKWSLHTDLQLRSADQWEKTETFIFRPGINYHPTKKDVITLGYAFINGWKTSVGIREDFAEHRVWQQYIRLQPLKKLSIQHRFRLEERFIPVASFMGNQWEKTNTVYSTRFRYFIRSIIPFRQVSPFRQGPFLALQEEVFFTLTNADNTNGQFFDQNRAYAALGWRFAPSFDLEAGYLNQYVSGRGKAFVNNHVIQLAIYWRK